MRSKTRPVEINLKAMRLGSVLGTRQVVVAHQPGTIRKRRLPSIR
jgi:hypothetical protein